MDTYAVIGAGPSGLAAVRALRKRGIPVVGYEASHGVGGLWDISNPRSTMYESAHLISSRTTTEFREFPMRSTVDYPGHAALLEYFREYADHFGLTELFRFDTRVTRLDPRDDGGWDLTSVGPDGEHTHRYAGVVLANGTLAEPNVPTFPGDFTGEVLHTSAYSSPRSSRDAGCSSSAPAIRAATSQWMPCTTPTRST